MSSSPTTPRSQPHGSQPHGSQPHGSQLLGSLSSGAPAQRPSLDASGWFWGDRLVLCAVAACALLIGYQLAVTLLQPPWGGVVTDWLRLALAWLALLIVAAVSWWTSRARQLGSPTVWLYTAALLSYAIARVLWTMESVFIYPHGVPFPILSDLFVALQYPFFFLGIILIPRGRPSTPRVILTLDFLLWMGAALTLSWFFLLAPIVGESDLSPLAKMMALSYPVGDLLVLLGLTVILLRPSRSRAHAPVAGILIAAFACLIVGDTWVIEMVLQPAHVSRSGGVPDLFWLSAYLLIPLAALVQLRITQRERAVNGDKAVHAAGHESRHEPGREDPLWQDIRASLPHFLPIVVALLASMVVAINAAMRAEETGWRGELWPIIMSSGLLLLVIVRQAIICLDRSRLRREKAVAQAHARALVELNRRKDEFLGVVSHEIRTPLTSVQGYIQLLARRLGAWQPPADGAAVPAALVARAVGQARAILASCEQSLQRLTRLADDLVDDTRIRDGQLTLRRAPCDLCALVRSAVEAQRLLEPDRIILLCPAWPACTPSADGDVPLLVDADADRIAQVVTNYLSNALKYSRADQPVEVVVEPMRQPGEGAAEGAGAAEEKGVARVARVAVRDAGPGLPEAEQAQVWERYPHIEAVRVQSGSGMSLGLGLSISKAIIERHGGEVGVESAPGQGSTFWFTLPLTALTPLTTLAPLTGAST